MERDKVLGIAAAVGLALSIMAGMPESGAASSKGITQPLPDNPKAPSTPEVPELKFPPTPSPYKPSP